MRYTTILPALVLMVFCSVAAGAAGELKSYPLNSMGDVITRDGVSLDTSTSADGGGSLKIVADGFRTVQLFESGDVDVEKATLYYTAKVKTKDLQGHAYLEMWCAFDKLGEYFSRNMDTSIAGTTGWTSMQTPFLLQTGQNPSNVKLNLVINGTGTVWIDDVKLVQGPLR